MFRRKPDMDPQKPGDDAADDLALALKPARPAMPSTAPMKPAAMPRAVSEPPRSEAAKSAEAGRVAEMPRRFDQSTPAPRKTETELRTLIVGREIALSGEITSCDRLVVEGSVEANLANCRDIDIAESGLFKGSASIDEAEIRGRFEGVLTVKKRLLIRSTGKVVGKIRYGQIEVERGGQISGEVSSSPAEGEAAESRPMGLKAVGEG
jgi:cytoskeletal protein CcmA (bactofilin family)